ncbi:MAG: hypothetical protein ACRAS9_01070 [Mycoplasma sp.]
MNSYITNFNTIVENNNLKINHNHETVADNFPFLEKIIVFVVENIKKEKSFIGTIAINDKTNEIYLNAHLIVAKILFDHFFLNKKIDNDIAKRINHPLINSIVKNDLNFQQSINYFHYLIKDFTDWLVGVDLKKEDVVVFFDKVQINVLQNNIYEDQVISDMNNSLSLFFDTSIAQLFENKLFNFMDQKLVSSKYSELRDIFNKEFKSIFSRLATNQSFINNLDNFIHSSLIIDDLFLVSQSQISINYQTWKHAISIRITRVLERNFGEKNKTITDFVNILNHYKLRFYIVLYLATKKFDNFSNLSTLSIFCALELYSHNIPLEFISAIIVEHSRLENNKVVIANSKSLDNVLRKLLSYVLRIYMSKKPINFNQAGQLLLNSIVSLNQVNDIDEFIKHAKDFLVKFDEKNNNEEGIDDILDDSFVGKFLNNEKINSPKMSYLLPKLIMFSEITKYKHEIADIKIPYLIYLPQLFQKNVELNHLSIGDLFPIAADDYQKLATNNMDIQFAYISACKNFSHLLHDKVIQETINTRSFNEDQRNKRKNQYIDLFIDVLRINK